MESTIAASTQPQVTVGVDTHKQFHVSPLLSMSSVARWAPIRYPPRATVTAHSCRGHDHWGSS